MATYFTNVGPKRGPFLAKDVISTIGVLQDPDNHMAMGAGTNDAGVKVWRLTVHGAAVPGTWVTASLNSVAPRRILLC
jgi:hypothetical protein